MFFLICIKPDYLHAKAARQNNNKTKKGIFSAPAQFDHRLNGAYFQWYLHDSKELVIAPGRWKKKDWLIFGGTAAATVILVFTVDKPVNDFFLEHQDSDFINGMNEVLNPFKAMTIPIFFGAVPIIYGLIAKSDRAKKVGLEVLEAQVVTSMVHYPINWIASRKGQEMVVSTTILTGYGQKILQNGPMWILHFLPVMRYLPFLQQQSLRRNTMRKNGCLRQFMLLPA